MKAVFLDIETTGLDFDRHVAIDIGMIIVDLNDYTYMHEYTSCIRCDESDWWFSDPKALEINGYSSQFHDKIAQDDWIVSEQIEEFFKAHDIVKGKAFFICQNPSFDKPFFMQLMCHERMVEMNLPYHWLDLASMYWMKYYATFYPVPSAHCIIPEFAYEISLSKDTIAMHIGIPTEEKPHKAIQGARHLLECYKGLCGTGK
jgi:oligoribonuclease